MGKLKGWRSIILQLPTIVFSLLAIFGFIVPDVEQVQIAAGYSTSVAVVMRFFTDTAIGDDR